MGRPAGELQRTQKAMTRLRMIQRYEQVTRNVSQTCRVFGISRTQFYVWLARYRQAGLAGLQDRPRGPHTIRYRVPPHVVALILQIRQERQYGVGRLSQFLRQYHQVSVSPPTIAKILRRHRIPSLRGPGGGR